MHTMNQLPPPQRGDLWVSGGGYSVTILSVYDGFSVTFRWDSDGKDCTVPLTEFSRLFRPAPTIDAVDLVRLKR
ncbi:MAG TPA: DUF4222 domain-containing protein [Polyangiaceae bacterium]|jgi:hypothetical protein